MRQFLFNGGDTAGIFAVDHIGDLFRQLQSLFLDDPVVFYDVDRDIVVDVAKDLQVKIIQGSLDLYDVLAPHLVALGILDDGHLALQFVQTQMVIDVKTFACLDMVQNDAFF